MDYRYTAIILKKREVGETDRLYTLYTREAGKIQAKAAGVRKQEAKLASSLETLSESEVMVVRTRGTGKIAGAILEKSFSALRQEYTTLAPILETAKNFERLVDLEEPDETLFQLLEKFLNIANELSTRDRHEKVLLLCEAFHFQLLNHLGYQLELSRSVVTGERLEKGVRFGVSPSAGGVVTEKDMRDVRDSFPLSENAIKLLRLFSTQPLEKMEKLSVEARDLAQIAGFRKLFLEWVRR